MGRQYIFEKWENGSTNSARNITVAGPLTLNANYKEVIQTAIVKISGSIDKQAQAGETVTLSILAPRATTPQVLTALTDAQGKWALPDQTYLVAGKYTINGSMVKDSSYDAASASATFDVALTTRVLTISVVVA